MGLLVELYAGTRDKAHGFVFDGDVEPKTAVRVAKRRARKQGVFQPNQLENLGVIVENSERIICHIPPRE